MEDIKRCPGCGRELPTSAFKEDKRTQDGLSSYCSDCIKQKRKKNTHKQEEAPGSEHTSGSMETKPCIRCGRVLPLSSFHIDKRQKDGHCIYCKDCRKEDGRERARRKYKQYLNFSSPSDCTEQEHGDTKVCPKCGKELPISEFYKKGSAKDGMQTYCKDCMKEKAYMQIDDQENISDLELRETRKQSSLAGVSDMALLRELKARGFKGTLFYQKSITL